tara:strand:- start:165 stop:686 length:522 start_codon:yes stop_codon:yes gene_type:complete
MITSCGLYKHSDARDNPVNTKERAQKNLEEGKGVRFGNLMGKGVGGAFDFASSNEMWRASIEILDFVSFVNASYSGGVLITDWFNNGSNDNTNLKITIRFLSNEIRADGIQVILHEKVCESSNTNCTINKIETDLNSEIKLAILKRAAKIKTNDEKIAKTKKKKIKRTPESAK